MRHTVFHGRLASILVVAVLSGCATAPADRGLRDVQSLLASRDPTLASRPSALSADPESIEQQITALLADPLSAALPTVTGRLN